MTSCFLTGRVTGTLSFFLSFLKLFSMYPGHTCKSHRGLLEAVPQPTIGALPRGMVVVLRSWGPAAWHFWRCFHLASFRWPGWGFQRASLVRASWPNSVRSLSYRVDTSKQPVGSHPLVNVLVSDLFGTLDPFGSGAFNSSEGFADFSRMSKVCFFQGTGIS